MQTAFNVFSSIVPTSVSNFFSPADGNSPNNSASTPLTSSVPQRIHIL